jgi:hypothetical protein
MQNLTSRVPSVSSLVSTSSRVAFTRRLEGRPPRASRLFRASTRATRDDVDDADDADDADVVVARIPTARIPFARRRVEDATTTDG